MTHDLWSDDPVLCLWWVESLAEATWSNGLISLLVTTTQGFRGGAMQGMFCLYRKGPLILLDCWASSEDYLNTARSSTSCNVNFLSSKWWLLHWQQCCCPLHKNYSGVVQQPWQQLLQSSLATTRPGSEHHCKYTHKTTKCVIRQSHVNI